MIQAGQIEYPAFLLHALRNENGMLPSRFSIQVFANGRIALTKANCADEREYIIGFVFMVFFTGFIIFDFKDSNKGKTGWFVKCKCLWDKNLRTKWDFCLSAKTPVRGLLGCTDSITDD